MFVILYTCAFGSGLCSDNISVCPFVTSPRKAGMPCAEAHHSNFFKDFRSQLNASEVISLYQFFFSWYLTILKSSSFVLKRETAGSISTWMSELFKLQEPGLFPLEYLWVLKAKIASSCQSESMHKLFS